MRDEKSNPFLLIILGKIVRVSSSFGSRHALAISRARDDASGLATGQAITSKRRSPWLCPAPSWGAGPFSLVRPKFPLETG
jgi:hypothetical protein